MELKFDYKPIPIYDLSDIGCKISDAYIWYQSNPYKQTVYTHGDNTPWVYFFQKISILKNLKK